MKIPVTYLAGLFVASESSRTNATELAGSASAFDVMNTRPFVVAAHSVDVSVVARSTAAIAPPARSPQPAAVRAGEPSATQSPHGTVKSPVSSLQCCRNSASVIDPMPCVFVRTTVFPPDEAVPAPAYIVRWTTGSVMIAT
jgi:hypothetical protein